MSKTLDAEQTSEVRELTDAELDSVNGGSSPSLLEVAAGMVITGVGEGVWIPLIRAGVL
jgi:lactobin A/cerein 7B family class IIb bacteriocin